MSRVGFAMSATCPFTPNSDRIADIALVSTGTCGKEAGREFWHGSLDCPADFRNGSFSTFSMGAKHFRSSP
jgi:hypothetical protein